MEYDLTGRVAVVIGGGQMPGDESPKPNRPYRGIL